MGEFKQDPKEWPVIEPLPSYGRGRERLGGRHISLIHGNGLDDVVITGKPIFLIYYMIDCFEYPLIFIIYFDHNYEDIT